jgi:hypothetical protein
MKDNRELVQNSEDKIQFLRGGAKLLKILKRDSPHETGNIPYIEILKLLDRAKIDLENVTDFVKDEIKTLNNIKEYLTIEERKEEFSQLNVIKFRLERLKEIIEKTEKIIQDAQEVLDRVDYEERNETNGQG